MKTIKNANSMKTIIRLVSAILLMLVGVGNVWGADETLSLGYSLWGTGGGYASSSGSKNTDASHAVSISWTDVLKSNSTIQLKASSGEIHSTSLPASSSNNKIKSIKITVTNNTIILKCSTDGTNWSDAISYTSGTAKDVSSGGYKYFKITSTSSYATASAVEVVYTTSTPQTVTFEKEGGTFDDESVFTRTTPSYQIDEASGGAGVTLPLVNPSAACAAEGWGFYGWKTSSAVSSETTTAPTIVGKAGDTYYPAGATTLYAVFAKGEFTKETSTITAGGKYLIVANSGGDNYVMTNIYDTYEESSKTYGKLKGWQVDETNTTTHTYSAADINADYVFSIVTSSSLSIASGDWMIENVADNYYLSPDYQEFYLDIDGQDPDGNTISAGSSSGTWNIINVYSSNAYRVYFDSSDKFFKKTNSTPSDLLIYKETTTSSYWSSPECCDKIVEVSAGTKTHISTIAFDITDVPTCGTGDDDRKVTITVTPSSGYTLNSTSRLEYSGDGTAAYVSGPTDNGNGTYSFVYQFEVDDDGSGSFAATAGRFTNYKTVCCDASGLAFDGEHNYQTLIRQDIAGATGPNHNGEGNPVATEAQGLAELTLGYTTSSSGTCTVEVKKLTGGDNRSTSAAGSDCSNHTTISVDTDDKEVTFQIWTYAGSYPTANGQGTYRIKLSQATASTYCATDVYYFVDVTLRDKFVDAVNGNATINVDGQSKSSTDYYKTPAESDLTETNDCDGTNRRLRGWISEMDLKTQYGTPGETRYLDDAASYNSSKVVAPYADIITSGCTWYAVWGVEE